MTADDGSDYRRKFPKAAIVEPGGSWHRLATPMRYLGGPIRYAAPGMLVIVAVQQIILSSTSYLAPWTGGGFGMFASIDTIATRIVRGVLVVDGRELPIRLGSSDVAGRALAQARALPTEARLNRVADLLARRRWRVNPVSEVAFPGDEDLAEPRSRPIQPSEIRLEVYRVFFDQPTMQVELVLLEDVTRVIGR